MSPSGAHIFLFCAPAARIIGRRFTRPCVRVVYAPHIAALLVILIERAPYIGLAGAAGTSSGALVGGDQFAPGEHVTGDA